MLIKLNQLTSVEQLRYAGSADTIGICVAAGPLPGGPCVDAATMAGLAAQRGDKKIAVSFRDDDGADASFIRSTIDRLDIDYYEFTPVDPAKRDDFLRQMDWLQRLDTPKIANGFYVQSDDDSWLEDVEPFRTLMAVGVKYVQFEVTSATSPDDMIGAAVRDRFSAFCEEIPVLISDRVSDLATYPIVSNKGFFFNRSFAARDARNYDCSLRSVPMSGIAALLRTRP